MGLLDFLLSNSAKRRRAAESLCIETGMLQECPVCRELTERDISEQMLERTERLGEERMAKFDPSLAIFNSDSEALRLTIRETVKRAPFSCVCERV